MKAGNGQPGAALAILLMAGTAVLAVVATLGVLYATGVFASHSRQEEVAERGAGVMPFDLEETTHIFEPKDNGGVQTVVADDPADDEQVSLVQEHLREEADKFSRGDLSDPASIHGQDMPGLKELESGASKISISYTDLPQGGRVEYMTEDPALVDAIHRWFEAQLSDHGRHAAKGDQHSMDH